VSIAISVLSLAVTRLHDVISPGRVLAVAVLQGRSSVHLDTEHKATLVLPLSHLTFSHSLLTLRCVYIVSWQAY
jgi:hypothetical protein